MKTLTEQYGIRVLQIGQRVFDEDFGWGIIEEIYPTISQVWHPAEFAPGMIRIHLDDGMTISSPACMIHLPHSLPSCAEQ